MEDEEFNLDKYRKAWQAESRRLEAAPPRHSEEEILAMLQRHNKPVASSRRTLYLWVGRAAASVVLLVGIAWLLLRQSEPALAPDSSVARLPQEPSAVVTPSDTVTPSSIVTPQTLTSHPSTLSASLRASLSHNRPFSTLFAETTLPAIGTEAVIAGDDIADIQLSQTEASKPAPATSESKDMQAFHGQKEGDLIDHSSTWRTQPEGHALEQTNTYVSWGGSRSFASSELTLSFGTSIESNTSAPASNPLIPAASLSFSLYSKTESRVCAFSKFGVTGLFDQSVPWVQLHFGYGLVFRPSESLTFGLNMGAYLMVYPFDLGLLFNAQASYRIADNFSLGLSYRYCTTGIVYDSRQMAFATISYLID